jgi:hypothetical protein
VTRIGPIFAWVLLAFCVAHGQAPSLVESCDTAPDQLATDSLLAQNGIAPRQARSILPAPQKAEQEPEAKKKEESQRVLGVIPHFGVTDRQDADPLRPREKFRLFLKSAFDPVTIGIVGVQAGLSQADNSFPDYGQGAQGYGKRFGAAFADEVAAGFFSNFAYPSLLKQDPRYFRIGKGSLKHRIFYSIKQEFVAHTDSGGRSFHFSNVLGALSGGGLSNIYYPSSDRGFALTMSRAGIAILYGTAGGVFDEFWPDISRKLFHKRNEKINPAPTETK